MKVRKSVQWPHLGGKAEMLNTQQLLHERTASVLSIALTSNGHCSSCASGDARLTFNCAFSAHLDAFSGLEERREVERLQHLHELCASAAAAATWIEKNSHTLLFAPLSDTHSTRIHRWLAQHRRSRTSTTSQFDAAAFAASAAAVAAAAAAC